MHPLRKNCGPSRKKRETRGCKKSLFGIVWPVYSVLLYAFYDRMEVLMCFDSDKFYPPKGRAVPPVLLPRRKIQNTGWTFGTKVNGTKVCGRTGMLSRCAADFIFENCSFGGADRRFL